MEGGKSSQNQWKKNNFSIENILSRPENFHAIESNNNSKKFLRQNPFQNNHILFDQSRRISESNLRRKSGSEDREKFGDVKVESEPSCHSESADSAADNETQSEIASDDGNCANQCKDFLIRR